MVLACDTDYLTKAESLQVAEAILACFGTTRAETYRLPAAVHMLRRGPLRRKLGGELADWLIPLVEQYRPIEGEASASWLDKMRPFSAINGGEADLFARVAETDGLILATGDKRALREIGNVPGLAEAIEGRIVTLESALLRLCYEDGPASVRDVVTPRAAYDGSLGLIFRPGCSEDTVMEGLTSFFEDCRKTAPAHIFWNPETA